MKKCVYIIISAFIMLSSAVSYAEPYNQEDVDVVKESGDVDFTNADEDNILIVCPHGMLDIEKSSNCVDYYIYIPMKNSGDYYTAFFEDGKYKETYKNFPATKYLKSYSVDEAKEYFSKTGLGEPSEINPFLLEIRENRIFSYKVICNGKSYIIPFKIARNNEYLNITNDPELEFEIGKVYTYDEFVKLERAERDVHTQYMQMQKDERYTKNHTHFKKDGETYCTWNCTDVDHALHLGKGTDEPEIIVDNEKTDTKKDTEKEPDKKTDDKEDNKKDDQKYAEKEPVNDTDVKKDDTDKPGEIKKPTGKTPDVTFSDVPKDHWAYNDITSLAERSVILGYGDGKFGVDDSVTHEQLSLLLKRQFNYDETDRAAQPAKREDIIVSLVKALNADLSSVDTADVSKFSDADSISADDERYIAYAVKSGLVLGYDGRLNLADNVTRAETAALICRALKLAK